jgi:hypothetical protein
MYLNIALTLEFNKSNIGVTAENTQPIYYCLMFCVATKRRKTSSRDKRKSGQSTSNEDSSAGKTSGSHGLTSALTRAASYVKRSTFKLLLLVDETLKKLVKFLISKIASVAGLSTKVPAPLLALLREKSPSRKTDVLSVPRTFTHSKYKRKRRDSERRCSLPTITEDVATGKSSTSAKKIHARVSQSLSMILMHDLLTFYELICYQKPF